MPRLPHSAPAKAIALTLALLAALASQSGRAHAQDSQTAGPAGACIACANADLHRLANRVEIASRFAGVATPACLIEARHHDHIPSNQLRTNVET